VNKTYFIRTFGCDANKADSQRIAAALEKKGYRLAKNIKSANLVVINSCIVRQSAENRVYGLIKNLLPIAHHPLSIILTGCLAGWALRDKSGKNLAQLRKRIGEKIEIISTEELADFSVSPLRNQEVRNEKTALIPISWGCSHFCSYCIVPYARGRLWWRDKKEILAEAKRAVAEKKNKIVLLGEVVNNYPHFAELLAAVAAMPGVKLVEFFSPNPWNFPDELIEVIAIHDNISKTIHLPVQSGSDEILKKMRRPYTVTKYLSLIERIKSQIENVKFTTDFIVGFPGETRKQFESTVKLCRKIGFSKAYINRYSPRPGTLAAKLYPDDVSPREKKRRWWVLEKLVNEKK